MAELKLQAFGESTVAVIPDEMLRRMKVRVGDTLHLVETPDGFLLTPLDEEVLRQIRIGREFMEQNRETFKRLADS